MSATTTIQKLRAEVQALRAENPEVAAIYSENELLRKAVEMYEARERKLATAIERALNTKRPVTIGTGSAPDAGSTTLDLGKARTERVAKDARRKPVGHAEGIQRAKDRLAAGAEAEVARIQKLRSGGR